MSLTVDEQLQLKGKAVIKVVPKNAPTTYVGPGNVLIKRSTYWTVLFADL